MKSRDASAHRRLNRSTEPKNQLESPESVSSIGEPALHWIAAGAFILLLGFQPIRGDDFWWQLSRGSVVAEGSLHPSELLLTMETQADADWLGGLPLYVVFQSFGAHAVMLARVLFIGGSLGWLLAPRRAGAGVLAQAERSRWRLARPIVWLVVTASAIALADRVNGTPAMFDCMAIAVLAALRHDGFRGLKDFQLAIVAFIFFATWSNLASGIFVGLIAWVTWDSAWDEKRAADRGRVFRRKWIPAGGMLLGGMVNPRGVQAWSDSLAAVVPSWKNSSSLLVDTPWQPLWHDGASLTALLFFLLSVIWVGHQTRRLRRFPSGVACFLWFQFLAWTSCQNVAMAATWMAADVLWDCRVGNRWFLSSSTRSRRNRLAVWAGPICVAAAIPIIKPMSSMGWGIDSRLDNRLLHQALETAHPYGTALADDTRSGGMLAWGIRQRSRRGRLDASSAVDRSPLQLQDVRVRSIITGRLAQHQRIWDDLREERLMSYRLSDGSVAGYWVSLEKRHTTLLVFSQCRTELIAGLEPSIWKPLTLDSPVLAYAQAGDAAYAKRMIEILSNREVVEYQRWQYTFRTSTGSIFDRDRWGLRPVLADARQSWRQAEVFRAMGLPYAALRVLFVAEDAFPDSMPIRCSIAKCQNELADAERIDAGRASRFRSLAVSQSRREAWCDKPSVVPKRETGPGSVAWDRENEEARASDTGTSHRSASPDREQELRTRVTKYLRHGPSALLVESDFDSRSEPPLDSQLMYAGLCGAIEAGDRPLADRYLRWLDEHGKGPALKRLVRIRIDELYPGALGQQKAQRRELHSQP